MDYISREEISGLAAHRGEHCVSIYLPTYRAGRQVEQNHTRFKNLVRKAQDKLSQEGLRKRDIDDLLAPAQQFLESSRFWQNQADGLAMFFGNDGVSYFRLPQTFDELVVTADRFHLKPLMSLLAVDGQFYLLALSKKRVRLYQGSRFGLSELDLPRMPESLAEVLKYDLFERQTQYHTGAPSRGGGRRDAVFFGTGDADTDEEEHLHRFFQELDKSLHSMLSNERSPLILAGVEYMIPIYRKANEYPHLLEDHVTGSPSKASEQWLHERAWPIAEAHFRKSLEQAMRKYLGLRDSHNPQASNDLEAVLLASLEGRVESLFVPVGIQVWGRIDKNKARVEIHEEEQPGDQDLLDLAALNTFTRKGSVYAVPPAEMPASDNIGAIYRY